MEILAENYIWFIIGVAIILMTIIGYIADKTNFGKKEFSKRKGPENSKVQKKTIEELEEEGKRPEPKKEEKIERREEPSLVNEKANYDRVERELPEKRERSLPREEAPVRRENVEREVEMKRTISARTPEPITPRKRVEEDLNAPFGDRPVSRYDRESSNDLRMSSNEKPSKKYMEEDLNVPFGDRPVSRYERESSNDFRMSSNERPSKKYMEEDLNVPFGNTSSSRKSNLDFDLPELDSIKKDVSSTSGIDDDDDIWKF